MFDTVSLCHNFFFYYLLASYALIMHTFEGLCIILASLLYIPNARAQDGAQPMTSDEARVTSKRKSVFFLAYTYQRLLMTGPSRYNVHARAHRP